MTQVSEKSFDENELSDIMQEIESLEKDLENDDMKQLSDDKKIYDTPGRVNDQSSLKDYEHKSDPAVITKRVDNEFHHTLSSSEGKVLNMKRDADRNKDQNSSYSDQQNLSEELSTQRAQGPHENEWVELDFGTQKYLQLKLTLAGKQLRLEIENDNKKLNLILGNGIKVKLPENMLK